MFSSSLISSLFEQFSFTGAKLNNDYLNFTKTQFKGIGNTKGKGIAPHYNFSGMLQIKLTIDKSIYVAEALGE